MPTIQKQRDELDDVRVRLEGWAMWLQATCESNLDFPRKTVFAIATGGVQEYASIEGAEIEEILVHLKREIPNAFKALKQYYYFGCSERTGANQLALSRNKFTDLKLQGESFVFTYLAMVKKFKKIA